MVRRSAYRVVRHRLVIDVKKGQYKEATIIERQRYDKANAYHKRIATMWGTSKLGAPGRLNLFYRTHKARAFEMQKLGKEAEVTAESILEALFSNVFYLAGWRKSFPFDYKGKKDGKICLIDVTCAITKDVTQSRATVATELEARYFVLHVSTKLKRFYLKEIKSGKCLSVPYPFIDGRTSPNVLVGDWKGLMSIVW
jgi:hypothetical protein